jgi:hypothetical protein
VRACTVVGREDFAGDVVERDLVIAERDRDHRAGAEVRA